MGLELISTHDECSYQTISQYFEFRTPKNGLIVIRVDYDGEREPYWEHMEKIATDMAWKKYCRLLEENEDITKVYFYHTKYDPN